MPTLMKVARRAKTPEKIGVGVALVVTGALTRGNAAAPLRSTRLSRTSSYIGNDSTLPPELLP